MTAARADPKVIDQKITTSTEVIFYVQDGADSPYQGRLVYDAAAYPALPKGKLAADQLAQFAVWKANLLALQSAPAPSADQLAQQVTDMQAQKAQLDRQIEAIMSDPVVAAKVAPADAGLAQPR